MLSALGKRDDLLDIAMELESVALSDDYFISRKLYPNVDFYTGLIYRAMGFPTRMFTVLFAIGRLPGWIAQWHEMINDPADPHRTSAPALHRRGRARVPADGEALTAGSSRRVTTGAPNDRRWPNLSTQAQNPAAGSGTDEDRATNTRMEAALEQIGVRLARGEPDALEDCYRHLGPLVISYLRRYVPPSDIDDVVQRVFYEVWRVHDRFDPDQSLRAWVLGIARKRAIDHLRQRRDVVVPLDSIREITGDDGREIAERFVWADEVRSALDLLPDMQREVIEMAYFEQYTQREISTALDIPLGTVKTRTARGLQRLAGLLENSRGR